MDAPCPHRIARPADGPFIAGHCPVCLVTLALEGSPATGRPENGEKTIAQQWSPATWSRLAFTPGTIVGDRYRIVARIGRGGMGEVYEAEDLKLGQAVALKFLSSELSTRPHAFALLSGEVRNGRQVAHPNVCRLYDLAEAEGQHFIVMEHVRGEDLGSLLARTGRLRRQKTIELARDICAGLAACHDRGVIHGDVKPGNVMIDDQGRARIMDFGLSTVVGTGPEARMAAGTLAYMAPEQMAGSGASVPADIYALGLVLYEIFSGRRVHEVHTIDQLRLAIENEPPPLSTFAAVPSEIDEMIRRCLRRRPALRPHSAAEVANVFPAPDPIEAALAANLTPSPAVVSAAAGGELSIRTAWAFLLSAVAGLVLTVAAADRLTAVGRTVMSHDPAALAERARVISKSIAFPLRRADEAYGFTTSSKLRSRIEPQTSTLAFFYREASSRLVPVMSLRRVGPSDPPLDGDGINTIGLDPAGNLRFLHARPGEGERPAGVDPVPWSALFALAGLDSRRFDSIATSWIPPVAHDEKREWVSRESGTPVRAALYRGRVVFFDVRDDAGGRLSKVAPENDGWTRAMQAVYVGLLALTFLAGGFVARRNIRGGRADLRGAGRVAGCVLLFRLLYWTLSGEISPADISAQVIVRAVGQALFEALQVWIAYLAIEPFVRRRRPRLIVSWARLIDGRVADRLIGRDLLVGSFFGILLVVVEHLRGLAALRLALPAAHPLPLTLEVLSGGVEFFATLAYCIARSLVFGCIALFLFLLLLTPIKKPVVAGTLWILMAAMTWIRGEQFGTMLSVAVTVAIVQAILSLLLISQYGLLASVTMFFVYLMLSVVPLTTRLDSWYRFGSQATLLIVLTLLAFGFSMALGRRPPFGRRVLEP